jgi:hypothetical protein
MKHLVLWKYYHSLTNFPFTLKEKLLAQQILVLQKFQFNIIFPCEKNTTSIMKYLVKKWLTLFCWENTHNMIMLHMEFLLPYFQL